MKPKVHRAATAPLITSTTTVTVSATPNAAPPPPPITFNWTENPFKCDGGTRIFGYFVGFSAGETVKYTSVAAAITNVTGTASASGWDVQWYCTSVSSWDLTATGQSSGRTHTITINGW